MSFHRNHFSEIVFDCTCGCGEELDTEEKSLPAASKIARDQGWRVYTDEENEWCHEAPGCRSDGLPTERI